MSHTCPPLSAAQFSSHKAHKARFQIKHCRSSDDTRTSALNALNPNILVVSVITVTTAATALQAFVFIFPLILNFLHGFVGLVCLSFRTDETFW